MFKEFFVKVKEKTASLWKKRRGKVGRKTVAALCALLLVGCAVVLNVFLFSTDKTDDDKRQMAVDLSGIDADGLSGELKDAGADVDLSDTDDYFATVSLGRQQARDEAMEVLLQLTESADALPEAKANAMEDLNRIALDIEKEGQIEPMITSRGFERCVAVVNGNSASVVVCTDALTPGETAQISEIVYEAAGIVPANLKMIEKAPA